MSVTVKALPDQGKPANFSGAVGDYLIESSMDKKEAEAGTPVTYRVRVAGEGNINTVETPALPKMEDFKAYDSSSSVHIQKDRLVVEGEKVTETVLVPKKAGTYTIPALNFSYFDPRSQTYRELKTSVHTLVVKPGQENEAPLDMGVRPVEKEEIAFVGKDIRYIKKTDDPKALSASWPAGGPGQPLYKNPLYWVFNLAIFLASLWLLFLSSRKEDAAKDFKGMRLRRSHRAARKRLRTARGLLKKEKKEEFYTEISRAVYGYFADKLNLPAQKVDLETIEQGLADGEATPELLSKIRALFDELALGRFTSVEKDDDDMRQIYGMADQVITVFEKVKLK